MPSAQPITTDRITAKDHYNNWPNSEGFTSGYEERQPVELKVDGYIPDYAAGTLYRTGPGLNQVKTDSGEVFHVSHWFDGFSQTHRFQILAPDDQHSNTRVYYNSRFSSDEAIERVRKTGSIDGISFGEKRDPCESIFKKASSEFVAAPGPSSINVGVTLSVNMPGMLDTAHDNPTSGIRTLYTKTDSASMKRLDPVTLEAIALAKQQDFHPDLAGPLSGAHAKTDPLTGDLYNYNLSFGPTGVYRVFCVSARTGQTTILATIPSTPAYLHSLTMTADYIILCVWNCHLNPQKLRSNIMETVLPFDPSSRAQWYVVDRKHGRGLVATYESLPFFCFHTINAWQEASTHSANDTDVLVEMVMYDNLDFLDKLYYRHLLSNSADAHSFVRSKTDSMRSSIARFRLPSLLSQAPIPPSSSSSSSPSSPSPRRAILEWTAGKSLSPELPTLNPAYATLRHRFSYSVSDEDESTFMDGLVKFDNTTRESVVWRQHGHSPGEAIFIADPRCAGEDDGVLLSVVLDGTRRESYLLCLDARDMTVLGRAFVGGPVGFGFHGQYVASEGKMPGDF